MTQTRISPLAAATAVTLFSLTAHAIGAYTIDSQYQFANPEGVAIVGPFIDGDGLPWVLGNQVDDGTCLLFGPFDRDNPAPETFVLPETAFDEVPYTQCTAVEPGPDDGFLIRGYFLEAPIEGGGQPITCGDAVCDAFEAPGQTAFCPSDCGPLGFVVLLDDNFEIVWGPTFDLDHVELGVYSRDLPSVTWSESRDRVLVFFEAAINLGVDTVPQLHGISIADGTGLVRRVITSWGSVGDGVLKGVEVVPTDGRFLVVGHSNGSEFLLYNGLESIDAYPGGDVAWSDEEVDYVQFGSDESLYVMHHPRLDLGGVTTSMTRLSTEGTATFYTRSLDRTVEVEVPPDPEPLELTLRRPVLAYATDSTFTFVRQVGGSEFALHVFDNFNGVELAIQPLSTVDDNSPTHMADARQPDRLILMTQQLNPDFTITRFVNTIVWDGEMQTPGGLGGGDLPGADDPAFPDAPDVGTGDAGGGGDDGGGDGGGCQTVRAVRLPGAWLLLAVGATLVSTRRRRQG